MNELIYRRAKPSEARPILNLINHYSAKGLLLPRPFPQVVERIRDFVVGVENNGGSPIRGTAALHVVGEDLAELRSLAVEEPLQGKGIGSKIVELCLTDARDMGLQRIFVLTYQTKFFSKLGFIEVDKQTLPQKIWRDCAHCAKFSDCDEIAMIKTFEPRS